MRTTQSELRKEDRVHGQASPGRNPDWDVLQSAILRPESACRPVRLMVVFHRSWPARSATLLLHLPLDRACVQILADFPITEDDGQGPVEHSCSDRLP